MNNAQCIAAKEQLIERLLRYDKIKIDVISLDMPTGFVNRDGKTWTITVKSEHFKDLDQAFKVIAFDSMMETVGIYGVDPHSEGGVIVRYGVTKRCGGNA